jgi:hypothetical protein
MPRILILEVSEFKLRGSEGSKPFGRPSDVLKNEKIRLALSQLEELLDGDGHESEIRSQPPSPIRPRGNEALARGNPSSSGSGSQEAFATQVSVRVQRNLASRVDADVSKPGIHQYLMGLLSEKVPPAEQNDNSTAKDTLSELSTTSANPIQRRPVLTTVSSDRVLEMTSKLEAKANEQRSQSSSSRREQPSDPKSQSISAKDSSCEDMAAPLSDDSEKENSQESLKGRRPRANAPKSQPIPQPNIEQETVQMSVTDQFQDSNPFHGLKRVPRRFVRIHESQQRLLEDKESWYKPPEDSRSTYANLPAKVRDDLIAFSEEKAPFDKSSQGGRASEVGSDDSDDGEQAQHTSSGYESEGLEGEEESVNLTEDEDKQTKHPRKRTGKRLETPSGTAGTLRGGNRGQNLETSSHGRQHIILSSISDGLRDEIDEARQSEDDDIPDEEVVSWPSSPEQRPNAMEQNIVSYDHPLSSSNKQGEFLHVFGRNRQPSLDTHPDMGASELELNFPTHHQSNNQRQNQLSTPHSVAPVIIPSSSPVGEEELEYATPYAVGDLVEENDSEEESSETFQRHPSTASQDARLVQVEQTPFPRTRHSGGRSLRLEQADDSLKEFKRVDDIISSDSRIPATCEAPAQLQTTPGSNEANAFDNESEMKKLIVEYRIESQLAGHVYTGINLKEEDKEDDLAQQQLFNEHESSQLDHTALSARNQAAISLNIIENPKRSSPERETAMLAPPRNSTTGEYRTGQQSPPLGTPVSTEKQLNESSPIVIGSMKRGSGEGCPQNPAKRRRRAPIARMIEEEDDPAQDTKEMARINRHSFSDNLLSARMNASIPTGSRSDCAKAKEVIPSTNPAVGQIPTLSPETAMQSSAMDGGHHVPATFEEPNSTSPPNAFKNVDTSMQSAEIDYHPAPASPIEEMDANCTSDGEEDDAVLRGTFLPTAEPVPHAQIDFYGDFMHMYPEYLGSRNAFTRALVYIEWIRENERFLPWARYDDFIRVHASDWLYYVDKNRDLGDKLMSGLKYYMENFPDQPSFKSKFITGENLQGALSSLDPEQVASYRAKYREPLQPPKSTSPQTAVGVATIQRSANVEVSEPALIGEGYLTLNSEEQLFISNGREASPELGAAKVSSGRSNHRPKRPFFETHSQLPAAKRQAESLDHRRPVAMGLTSGERKTNSNKVLPWNKNDSPGSSSFSSPRSEAKFSTPTASRRKNRGRLPSADQRDASSPTGQLRRSLVPPVPVSRSESSRPLKRVKTSSTPPSRDPDVFKRHSLPASSVISLSRPNMPKQTITEGVSPRGPMLQEFLARRNKNGSTPKTTPGKRFCTKPAKSPPRRIEPETQGWDS